MKRTSLTTCSCVLLVCSCLAGGCGGVKRFEIGAVKEPPIIDASVAGASIKIHAIGFIIEWEKGEQ